MEGMDKAKDKDKDKIVEKILSFMEEEDFLKCRLINKYWNAAVLHAFPKREGLYLDVGTYMEQKYSKGRALLPKEGSWLGTRVFVGGTNMEDDEVRDPKDFLLFFRSGEGLGTEVLFLDDHSTYPEDEGLTWGGALHEVLTNNLAPSLRELTLDYVPEGRINDAFENGDTDLTEGLQGLRALEIRCCYDFEEIVQGSFTPFVFAMLQVAGELEKIVIRGALFPLAVTEKALQNLKVLELRLMTVKSSLVPVLERVLNEVSKNIKSLETLSLPFMVEPGYEDEIDFPKFPNLKVFTFRDLCHLPLNGDLDLTHFLREKMPLLRSLIAVTTSGSWDGPIQAEVFWKTLKFSKGPHTGLQFLSVPAPIDPRLLKGLQTKFPSLKRLDLSPIARTDEMRERKSDVFWLTELALVLATRCESLHVSIRRKVGRKFMAKVGQKEWKGNFQLYKWAIFADGSEIRK